MSQSQALLTLGFLLLNKVSHPYYSTYSPVCFNSSGSTEVVVISQDDR